MARSGTRSVDLKVSLLGQGLVTVAIAAILVAIFFIQVSLLVFLGALVVLVAIWAWLMQRINTFRWRRLTVSHDGEQVILIGRDKYREAGRIARRYAINPLVCCFSVEGERGRHLLCLFSDSTASGQWRKLVDVLKR
ncbi:MAG: protein YgfX [Wenzhouxiangella sp.]